MLMTSWCQISQSFEAARLRICDLDWLHYSEIWAGMLLRHLSSFRVIRLLWTHISQLEGLWDLVIRCFRASRIKALLRSLLRNHTKMQNHIDGLMQERCNSIADALEFHLLCTNTSIPVFHENISAQKVLIPCQGSLLLTWINFNPSMDM